MHSVDLNICHSCNKKGSYEISITLPSRLQWAGSQNLHVGSNACFNHVNAHETCLLSVDRVVMPSWCVSKGGILKNKCDLSWSQMLFDPEQILLSLKEQPGHLTYIAGTSDIVGCSLAYIPVSVCIKRGARAVREEGSRSIWSGMLHCQWNSYMHIWRYFISRYLLNWCPWFDVGVFKEKEWLIWGSNSGSLISRLFIKEMYFVEVNS